jgi:hypothetical protein
MELDRSVADAKAVRRQSDSLYPITEIKAMLPAKSRSSRFHYPRRALELGLYWTRWIDRRLRISGAGEISSCRGTTNGCIEMESPPLARCTSCGHYTYDVLATGPCLNCHKGSYRSQPNDGNWKHCENCAGSGNTIEGRRRCLPCQGTGWISTKPLGM